uniref:Legumain n=1 Tax=Plectus sambesii TaxID=2011161 RepID=A0A914XBL5_9BILA
MMKSAVIICLLACVALAVQHHKFPRHHGRKELRDGGDQPKIWALLVAGSNGWSNYRHQADVCHAYKILRVGKDYVKEDVNPQNFLNILQGNKKAMKGKGSGRVIESGPNDHVFVYFTDHGATGLIAFPDDTLSVKLLNDALKKMHRQKRFNQLVFYLEACESGSMFKNVLPTNIDVYAITAANDMESSWGCYCENDMHLPCLGDLFSVNWMQDSDAEDLTTETLQQQFIIVQKETNKSHVQHFGNLSIAKEAVANFQGYTKGPSPRYTAAARDKSPWPVHDITLMTLKRQRDRADTESERSALSKQIHRLHQKRQYLQEKMTDLVEALIHDPVNRRHILNQHPSRLTQLDCHDTVTRAFNHICFPFSQNPYALKYVYVLANLCEEGIDQERILQEMQDVCIDISLPLGGVE